MPVRRGCRGKPRTKENREIPPLDYDLVHQIKADNPDLHISINGGITTLDQAEQHLDHGFGWVSSCAPVTGRAAYHYSSQSDKSFLFHLFWTRFEKTRCYFDGGHLWHWLLIYGDT